MDNSNTIEMDNSNTIVNIDEINEINAIISVNESNSEYSDSNSNDENSEDNDSNSILEQVYIDNINGNNNVFSINTRPRITYKKLNYTAVEKSIEK